MDRIIAGRFETKSTADTVALQLRQFVASSDICIFHNNPPGQHGLYPVGGDEAVDPGADGAGESSAGGAAAAGVAAGTIGAIGGPIAALAAGAAGAYIGSMAGALQGLGNEETNQAARRPAGVILCVRVLDPQIEARAINILHAGGAVDIEQADGEWRNGDWVDFNPIATPRLVKLPSE
jgi:hypothetical protein